MNPSSRVLVFRPASLGDALVSVPAFRLIRQAYPHGRITALTAVPLTGKAVALETLLQPQGLLDEVIHYRPGGGLDQGLKLWKRLRQERFTQVIVLAEARNRVVSLRDFLFFKACGLPVVLGVPWQRDFKFIPRENPSIWVEPEAQRLVRRLHRLGTLNVDDPAAYRIVLSQADRAEAEEILQQGGIKRPFLAFSLGAKLSLKQWGHDRWRALLEELTVTFPQFQPVALGSADEAETHQHLLSVSRSPALNACGLTRPGVSAAILEKAGLFLGHDSGPMHLAAAVGTRCVALFSAHNPPGQWFPLGSGHVPLYPHVPYLKARRDDPIYQRQAMETLTVPEVLAAVRSCLKAL